MLSSNDNPCCEQFGFNVVSSGVALVDVMNVYSLARYRDCGPNTWSVYNSGQQAALHEQERG